MASNSGPVAEPQAQSNRIEDFCSVTACTPEQAFFYLEASNQQFDRAVAMFFEQGPSRDDFDFAYDGPEEPNSPREAVRHQTQPQNRQPQRNLLGLLFGVPRAVFQTSFGILFRTVNLTAQLIGLLSARILPAPVLRNIQGGMRSLTEGRFIGPEAAASSFIQSFAAQYGDIRPRWLATSWAEGARVAHNQFKFLLVYLHSPSHQDTETFCHNTLCDPEVVEYVNANFVCWAGDITQPDAFQLSQGLRVQTFPYIGLLAFSGQRTRLVAAAEGLFTAEALLPVLREAQEQQSIHLMAEQVEHNERDYNRRLREEQDAEYQKSLEADRERQRQRQAATQAETNARQIADEAAARERAAMDAEQKRLADREAAIANRRETKAASLGGEPAAGSSGSIQIRVRLPDGANHQRRFLGDEHLQRAYDFVDSLENFGILKYSLASSYPRRVFSGETLQQSFQALGLAPQALLFVQSEDD